MEGYDTNLITSLFAYPSFADKFGTYDPNSDKYIITGPWQIGLGVAYQVGAVIGLLINGIVTEKYGHRLVTMVGLVVTCGFIFILFFAPTVEVLVVGEVMVGIPWGIFAIMGSAYASEVCPLALRGYLTSFVNICWVLGQFVAAGVLQGLVDNRTVWGYRIPFAVQWAWPIPLFLIAFFAPDSPWWLVRKDKEAEAERSLKRLSRGLTDKQVKQTVAMMVHTDEYEKSLQTHTSYKDCFRGTNLRRTEIACMALSSQTLPGQALAYNATYFFTQAGLESSNAYKLNFGDMGIAIVATCISWVLMAYFGKRKIMVTGLSLLSLDLLIIGFLEYASNKEVAKWTQAGFALAWLGIYSATVGPPSFAMAAEISATRLRSQTISIARNAYNVFNIMDNVIEPYLINPTEANLKGKAGLVWFAFALLTTAWAALRLPETKGKTYEELDVLFEKRIPAWKFASTEFDVIAETEGRQQSAAKKELAEEA